MEFNNEIEKTKAEIKVLEKKLSFLEEIEKQPRMNLRQEGEYAVVSYHDKVYYRLEGDVTFLWYIKKGVSANHRVPTLVMVEDAETERLLEGLYYNHIQVKKEKVSEEPEENEWKSVALRFGEKLSGYLSDGYYELSPAAWFRWAVFTYGKGQQIKDAVRESVKWSEEHPDKSVEDYLKPQTPEETEQSLKEAFREAVKQGVVSSVENPKTLFDVIQGLGYSHDCCYEIVDAVEEFLLRKEQGENDKNFKNSLDLIREWGEKNKSPTLKELLWEWWEDIFTADSDLDADASIDSLVDIIDKKFIPPSSPTNSYDWEKCLKMMRDRLRVSS